MIFYGAIFFKKDVETKVYRLAKRFILRCQITFIYRFLLWYLIWEMLLKLGIEM
ncbi:hypothetical protein HNR33_002742 [Brassicibacter mesophilus]